MDNKMLAKILSGVSGEFSEKFTSYPWPSTGQEEWRRTNLTKYDLSGFTLQENLYRGRTGSTVTELNSDEFSMHIVKSADNAADIRVSGDFPDGITVYDPSVSDNDKIENLEIIAMLAKNAALNSDNRTAYLAMSSFKDSLFIIIGDNITVPKPVLVEFNASRSGSLFLTNHIISAGKGSEVEIIQKIKASGRADITGNLYLRCEPGSKVHTAAVTEIKDNSVLFLNRSMELSEEASLSDFQSYTGGTLIKTRTEVKLSGEKGDARLYGTVLSDKKSHIDLRTVQHHTEKNCFSQAEIKTIVRGRGRSIYQGLIEVEEEASLTDAYLTNNNIVLNDGSRADSIPSLKIRNNNVKCSHGATTGKIDEEQVLYLTSRGLVREEAKKLILEGFLGSVYDQLSGVMGSYCSPFLMEKLKQTEAVH